MKHFRAAVCAALMITLALCGCGADKSAAPAAETPAAPFVTPGSSEAAVPAASAAPEPAPETPAELSVSVLDSGGGAAFSFTAPELIAAMAGRSGLLPDADEWTQLGGGALSAGDCTRLRTLLGPAQSASEVSIFSLPDGGVAELRLTFDDHGYLERVHTLFGEVCVQLFQTLIPELGEDGALALYDSLYALASGSYIGPPPAGAGLELLKTVLRYGDIGLSGYYGAGTVNIVILPLTDGMLGTLEAKGVEVTELG